MNIHQMNERIHKGISDINKEAGNELVFSYLTLRNYIGFSGMLLPLVLVCTTKKGSNDKIIEASISNYYYSNNGDVLVVMLSVLAVFLFTYKGYEWKEKALTILAAICALGIAFSPMAENVGNSLTIHVLQEKVPMLLAVQRHFVFAALFFISLAIMSIAFFPKGGYKNSHKEDGALTQKAKRNYVFRITGWVMLACVGMLAIYFIITPDWLKDVPVVFILETIAIEAFGLSWITKGQTLWADNEQSKKDTVDIEKQIKNVMVLESA